MTDEPRKRRPRARRAITPTAAQLEGAPDFAPVPRQKRRCDGWTYDRQRAFVVALAHTGTVERAAAAIGMTAVGAYQLRRQPGAEGFAQAWADALAVGVERLTDVMMERAIHGVPIPVFHLREQIGERRWYNDRLLMFALRHHDPERYGRNSGGTASVPPHVRRALRAEWEAEQAEQRRREMNPDEVRKRILAKIAEVRRRFGEHDALVVDGRIPPDPGVPPEEDPFAAAVDPNHPLRLDAPDPAGAEAAGVSDEPEPLDPVAPAPRAPGRAEISARVHAPDERARFLRDSDIPAADDPQIVEQNHRRHWQAMVDAGKIGKPKD